MPDVVETIKTALRLKEPIGLDTPLISTGLIDSFDVVTLLTLFESHFGVVIDPETVGVDDFDTPRQMMSRIEQLAN